MEEIIRFYDVVDEEQRFQRNSRRIEFLTSIRALEEVIQHSSKILELGAGTGAYSFHYADKGHVVTALDVTPSNINKINEKKSNYKNISLKAIVGDATDLSQFESGSFNTVLCFGPYYHVIDDIARLKLIEESLRVLAPGGILATAYINKHSVVPMLVKKIPNFINDGTISKVMDEGYLKARDPESFWTDSHYTTPNEIEELMNQFDVSIVDHLGTDGLSHTLDNEIDKLSEQKFEIYKNYHFKTCRDRSILGMSTHGLIICRKN
ncbi:class I SAM-dependent methyltransferase [Paenibacillus lemnae]|uniref:Class I SAM-dependent methyltransferase n=1 Tax=Paenibacillus lemnae TaxID=1330551 RepID=A0A848MAB3_PAELE|nr:class I SAM-dependent methyltransferase [Paenibacillus lemnae]NMO98188.1 class I SAM-dependent methyltransferase [Paenibacillus lemnae]